MALIAGIPADDLLEGCAELDKALPAYERAEAYYQGTVAEVFESERVAAQLESTSERYQFRLARVPVNAMANKLRLAAITSTSEAIDRRIEQIREANSMDVQEPEWHRWTCVYGDTYALHLPVEDAEGVDPELLAAGVEIIYFTPKSCRMIYTRHDGQRRRFMIYRWQTDDGRTRADLWYEDRVERFVTRQKSGGERAEDWLLYGEDEDGTPILDGAVAVSERPPADLAITDVPMATGGSEWPLWHAYEEVPWTHFRNALPYGRPEHEQAYGPQNAINKLLAGLMVTTDSRTLPERWALAEQAGHLDSNANDMPGWDDDADATSAQARGGAQHVDTRPGAIALLQNIRQVGEFKGADPGVFLDPLEMIIRLMAVVCETPLWEFDPTAGTQLSGVSREKAAAPHEAKVSMRRPLFAGSWMSLWSLVLRMAGEADPGAIDIRWERPPVENDPEFWRSQRAKQEAGVSTAQTLLEGNYQPEQVQRWLEEEGATLQLASRVDLLKQLGEGLQSLGSAVALGVIDAGQSRALAGKLIGDLSQASGE